MKLKQRVILSFGAFVLLSGGLGGWFLYNDFRLEKVFRTGQNALRLQQLSQDVEFFLNRKSRSIENYVMLGEEAEKLQALQSEAILKKRFDTWEDMVRRGVASRDDFQSARAVYRDLSRVGDDILALMTQKRKPEAFKIVVGEFSPAAIKAKSRLKAVTDKTGGEADAAEKTMLAAFRQNHITSLAAVILACVLAIVLALSLYRSVTLPMKVISSWADQIAQGHMQVTLNIPGHDEISELAQNFNAVVQNLAKKQAEKPLAPPQKPQEKISTLDEAVEGFRQVLEIMGGPAEKKNRG